MTPSSQYRSRVIANNVIAFSVSFRRANLLSRGMGLEHLRELLIQLARPILRQGADLAYGGNWNEPEDNFTYDLLNLISAEQEAGSSGGPDSNIQIGKLFNHLAWPYYLHVTPRIEAQWINNCRIIRVTQSMAGIPAADRVADEEAETDTPRAAFNQAVTLSAMRRLMMEEMQIDIVNVLEPERIPAASARILLGGRTQDYSGFMPGIFEEALVTFERNRPLYILGGFGSAAEILADAILGSGTERAEILTLEWQKDQNPRLQALLENAKQFTFPPGIRSPERLYGGLSQFILQAQVNPAVALNTGLSELETRELLKTRDVGNVVRLVHAGLTRQKLLPVLPA